VRDPVRPIRRTEKPGRVSEVRWRREDAHSWRIHKDWDVCHLIGDIEEAHANKISVRNSQSLESITRTRLREHPFGPLGLHPKLVPL
jgi:hypothetical protein